MNRKLNLFAAIFAFLSVTAVYAEKATEEFHQTYALSRNGQVSLENVNGDVYITAWDRNEVKVDAIKTGRSAEDLQDAKIVVKSDADSIHIETKYSPSWGRNHSASVEYRLNVPRDANLNSIELVNGSLEITDVKGEVNADCVNGGLTVKGLAAEADLGTVNGSLEASFDQLNSAKRVSMESVNGRILLTVPANSDANFEASTVSGSIRNDFGFRDDDEDFVGHEISGTLGKGTTRVKLSNVNGSITIRKM